MSASFYAVKRGKVPGIYETWDQCDEQVTGYSGASHKKFKTLKEASAFVDSANLKTKLSPSPSNKRKRVRGSHSGASQSKRKPLCENVGVVDREERREDCLVVYTDGSCLDNGKESARAGIGVYWGPSHLWNVSERLVGRQTNQRAEIMACCRALEIAKEQRLSNLEINTDSKFVINAMTDWIPNWKKSRWKRASGKDITNEDEFKRLDELANGVYIKWTHVRSHHGVVGNEEADKLARNGASKPLPEMQVMGDCHRDDQRASNVGFPSKQTPDLAAILSAVVKCASQQWYSVALKMGFVDGKIRELTHDQGDYASKLQGIVNVKAAEVGEQECAQMLLKACEQIPYPVIAAVRKEIDQLSHHKSQP